MTVLEFDCIRERVRLMHHPAVLVLELEVESLPGGLEGDTSAGCKSRQLPKLPGGDVCMGTMLVTFRNSSIAPKVCRIHHRKLLTDGQAAWVAGRRLPSGNTCACCLLECACLSKPGVMQAARVQAALCNLPRPLPSHPPPLPIMQPPTHQHVGWMENS